MDIEKARLNNKEKDAVEEEKVQEPNQDTALRYQILPQAIDAEAEEDLQDVRARLGLPSRRAFLAGAAAVAGGFGSERARAVEKESVKTPEQERAYLEGIQELRESARTTDAEEQRYFIARPDGTSEWRVIEPLSTSSIAGEAGSLTVIRTSYEDRDALRAERRNGAFVEQLHSHATKQMLGDHEHKDMVPGADRSPPSTVDVYASINELANLTPEEAGRQRFTVVTEAGTWSHGPSSPEAAQRLTEAFAANTPTLELLDAHTKEGAALASYIRERFAKDEKPMPDGFEDILNMMEEGRISTLLKDNPMPLEALASLDAEIHIDRTAPSEARAYTKLLANAHKQTEAALRKIAPRTDGQIGSLPPLHDVAPYVNRWKQLGVDMIFTPFDRTEEREKRR